MQSIIWNDLSNEQQQQLLQRPLQSVSAQTQAQVDDIIELVRSQGDAALKALTARFDGCQLEQLRYSEADIAAQAAKLDSDSRAAIDCAYQTISRFHQAQQPQDIKVETVKGVTCELRYQALESVGLYIPGGSAVLPSTALMLGIPAQLANCRRRVLVTPPAADGSLSPALMYAAQRCGISEVYRVGGAQAIAALAFGSESIAPVDKIFGPGNSYVTTAKQRVSQSARGCAIDMPAGPSELLVIADAKANPAYVAADLLSQAEHGADSQVILLSDNDALLTAVSRQLSQQLRTLARASIAQQALTHSRFIRVDSIAEAVAISERYAPEHLSLQVRDEQRWLAQLSRAGSIFVGPYTPESGGDYATGTNHVLPTDGFAASYSSLGLLDFYRRYTVQRASRQGLATLAPAITRLAELESLDAHARAVSIRFAAVEVNS
ncbi:histidinol dehydrogenase [Idiomarina xiamenensis]|uniref:Histidinol dehydrogenase n=1 Tax=Idiomarina xiamenensis 10-D-4 TaxID=740709 RepID=K2KYN9_9GAMM|nr:histidinol dehydrogenase [Idiomarina xiamenensis]EKE82830.1 histidinol dehydrogenase [Idiomarina xiamenensis 10-D-4]